MIARTGNPAQARTRGPRLSTAFDLAAILLLCTAVMWLRWGTLDSLLWMDPAVWLNQIWRVSLGELPYRDFTWNYPPFAVLALGWTLRVFGPSFWTVQVAINAVSLALVLLCYGVARRLMPRSLQLAVSFLLIAICSTSLTKFNLFSFSTYSPSLAIGSAGYLLLLIGSIDYFRSGLFHLKEKITVAAGGFVAAFSKPETWLACCATLAVLAVLDRKAWFRSRGTAEWLRFYLYFALLANLPAVAAYYATGSVVGWQAFLDGLGGYGLASFACPWWPTGLGVFGGAAGLGQAAAITALLSLPWRRRFREVWGNRYQWLLAAGLAGAGLFAAYEWYLNADVLTSAQPIANKLEQIAPNLVWTSPVLLPAMWAGVAYSGLLCLRLLRGAPLNYDRRLDLLVLAGPVAMSLRGLFSTTLYPYTEVSAICYPFFILLGPYLLWKVLDSANVDAGLRHVPAAVVVIALAAGYGVVRLAGAYPRVLAPQLFRPLETAAGTVRLRAYERDAAIYRYVISHTNAADAVLDLPYGGGLNFAARRRSPAYVTQHFGLFMASEYQDRDLARTLSRPPRLVIANPTPNAGTLYGVEGTMRCPCPRLVWKADQPSSEPSLRFPLVDYIQHNYRPVLTVYDKVVLAPAGARP